MLRGLKHNAGAASVLVRTDEVERNACAVTAAPRRILHDVPKREVCELAEINHADVRRIDDERADDRVGDIVQEVVYARESGLVRLVREAVLLLRIPCGGSVRKRLGDALLAPRAAQDDRRKALRETRIGRRKQKNARGGFAAPEHRAARDVDECIRPKFLARNEPDCLRRQSGVEDHETGVAVREARGMYFDSVNRRIGRVVERTADRPHAARRGDGGDEPPLVAALRESHADVVDCAFANLTPRNRGVAAGKRRESLPSGVWGEFCETVRHRFVFSAAERELRHVARRVLTERDAGKRRGRCAALAAPLVEAKGLLREDERAAGLDPRLEPGGRLVVHGIYSCRDENAIAVEAPRPELLLEHGVERNVGVNGKRIRACLGEGLAFARGSLRQTVRRHREKRCHALLLPKAAQARREEVLHREDVALRVHYPDKLLGRNERRVETEPREPLAEALQALGRIFHVDLPQAALPLEVVARVEPARPLRQQPRAVARARAAEVRLAVDHGLAVREGAQSDVGIEAAAAGRHHRHLAEAIRGGGLDDVADARHRLEAEARRGVDLAYRLDAEFDAGHEALLAELVPRDEEARSLIRRLERRGRLERAV